MPKAVYDEKESAEDYKNKANIEVDEELVTYHRRCKYFTDGGILGTKLYLFEMSGKFLSKEKQEKKKFSEINEDEMYSYKKLKD